MKKKKEKKEKMNKKSKKRVCGQFLKSLVIVAVYLCTLRVLAGTESLVEYVYVSKRVCNCRVWEF